MRERTTAARQVRDEFARRLGRTLGPLYNALYQEVALVHLKWSQYRILFAQSPERVELLNSVAGNFFWMLQRVLWSDVLMHIARLTDPLKSSGKDNLTLSRLNHEVPELSAKPALCAEIEALVEKARYSAKFVKDWRNRRLAHTDLDLALERKAKPLEPIAIHKVERALDAIGAVLKTISVHLMGEAVVFEVIVSGDAESLAFYLKSAIDAEAREKQEALGRLAARKEKK